MKNILIIGIIGILGLSAGLVSCAPDYETDFNVKTLIVPDKSQAAITFPLAGGTREITVETNVEFGKWQAKSNAEWCMVVAQEGKVIVSADENNIYKQRKAEITIAYGHQSYTIPVSQFGHEPKILIGEKMENEGYVANLDPTQTIFNLPVATNLDIDNVIVPDTCSWVHFTKEPETFRTTRNADDIKEYELVFSLDQNTDTVERYCTIILQSSQNYNYTASFTIKQLKRGYIVDVDDAYKVFDVKAMGGTITVPFEVNGPVKAYTYQILGKATEWIKPVPATRAMRDTSESFIIEPNTEVIEQSRTGQIEFTSTDPNNPNSFIVTVNQAEFIPTPPLNVTNVIFTPKAGQILLQWETPEQVDYMKVKIAYTDNVTKENKEIVINNYETTSALIGDTYECAGEYEFMFTTYGPTGMETDTPVTIRATSGKATAKEQVVLTLDMLSANATQEDDGIGLIGLIDGKVDKDSYYHTKWSKPVTDAPHHLQIKLNSPLQELYFEYNARIHGSATIINNPGDVKTARIEGSQDGTYWETMGIEEFNLPTTRGGLATGKNTVVGKEAYKYIRFIPTATRQDPILNHTDANHAWWNMSEIQLYRIRHDENWAKEQLGI